MLRIKALLMLFACLTLTIGLTACGDEGTDPEQTPSPDAEPQPDPTPDPTPTPTPDPTPDPQPAPEPDPTPDPEPEAADPLCDEFMACGGSAEDLIGTWDWQGWCQPFDEEDPFDGACELLGSETTVTPIGESSFREDGTYEVEAIYEFRDEVRVPTACFDDPICGAHQAALDEAWACGPIDGECVCTRLREFDGSESGTWSIDGSLMEIVKDDPEEAPRLLGFCIDGDTISLRDKEGDDDRAIFTFSRR